MTKDEMKTRISMALKDPILQQGFECICKELEAEKKLNEEIKVRFVKCNTCTDEMKDKCIMFSENLCEGERCEELVDLMELINKSDLQKENAELKSELTKKTDTNHSLVEQMADLEHENALLKGRNEGFEQQIMGLLIKYEEIYKRFPDLKSAMDKAQTVLKENAELKERVKILTIHHTNAVLSGLEMKVLKESHRDRANKTQELLTKAKELLEEFCSYYMYDCDATREDKTYEAFEELKEQAENFLKE